MLRNQKFPKAKNPHFPIITGEIFVLICSLIKIKESPGEVKK